MSRFYGLDIYLKIAVEIYSKTYQKLSPFFPCMKLT